MDGFLKVDFYIPVVLMAVSVVLVLIGIPLAIHALARRRKFAALRDGEQTYARSASIRTEFICAGIASGLAVTCLVLGLNGYAKSMSNLEANIQQEFSPTALEINYWNGSWASVKIALPDGRSFENAMITVNDGYRPVMTEDVIKD